MSETDGPAQKLGDYAESMVARDRSDTDADQGEDPLAVLDEEDPIFADKGLLRIDHIPDQNKIVGRDDEIQAVARRLKPAISGGSGKGTLILGKSGSGKTLVTRYVSREVLQRGDDEGTSIGLAVVDCGQRATETQVIIEIAQSLNQSTSSISIPDSGIATGSYYDRLWKIIDNLYDSIIIVLDEIDRLAPRENLDNNLRPQEADDSKLLMQLSRAGEEDDIDAGLSVIGISNDLKYGDRLDTRVESSFSPDELVFPAYDADQLGDILERRSDAFREEVLGSEVIPLCSAFSAQEHGDARRAIDLFRLSGEIARDWGEEQVTEDHVRVANDDAEVARVRELIRGCPTQSKIAIAALATMDEFTTISKFEYSDVYAVYELFAKSIDADVLSQRRILDQIREFQTLNMIHMNRTTDGYREGTYLEVELLDEPELLLRTIALDSRLEGIPLHEKMREKIISIVQ